MKISLWNFKLSDSWNQYQNVFEQLFQFCMLTVFEKKYDWKGCRYMYMLIGCNKVDNKSLKYVFGASLKYLVLNELFNHNI